MLGAGAAGEGLSSTSTGPRNPRERAWSPPSARGRSFSRPHVRAPPSTRAHTHTLGLPSPRGRQTRLQGQAGTPAPAAREWRGAQPPGAAHAPRFADAPEPGPIKLRRFQEETDSEKGSDRAGPQGGEGSRCPGCWPPELRDASGTPGWSERSGPGRPCRPLRAQQAERGCWAGPWWPPSALSGAGCRGAAPTAPVFGWRGERSATLRRREHCAPAAGRRAPVGADSARAPGEGALRGTRFASALMLGLWSVHVAFGLRGAARERRFNPENLPGPACAGRRPPSGPNPGREPHSTTRPGRCAGPPGPGPAPWALSPAPADPGAPQGPRAGGMEGGRLEPRCPSQHI